MFKLDHLTFSYGSAAEAVFTDFSYSLPASSICGLLGRNGTGKSTLLYLMCGLLRPQGGSVTCNGIDVGRRRPETLSDTFLVPEEYALPDISFDEYVRHNAIFYPRFSEETLCACLDDFDLPRQLRLGRLSMGQKKKVLMSFALATHARLLVMDEPTNGLDIPAKSQFRKVVSRCMTDESTVIISTHQVRDIDSLLDHVSIIDSSRLLLDSPVDSICRRYCFDTVPAGQPVGDAIYTEPSVQGNAVVRPNADGRDTPLNLELLFNAVLASPASFATANASNA